jgi:hypothetical protein
MLDTLLDWQYSFWALAFLIAALDSIVLLPPGQFCFGFGSDGRPTVRTTMVPFLIRGRELMFAAASYFARPYFISSVNSANAGEAQLAELRVVAKSQRMTGLCSAAAAMFAFVAGPVVTARFDIGSAILAVLPLIYLNAVVAVIAVAISRKAWRLSAQNIFYIAFELLVCPVLVVNLNKRLAYRAVAIPNTFQLIGSDGHARERILANLEYQAIPAPQAAQGQ